MWRGRRLEGRGGERGERRSEMRCYDGDCIALALDLSCTVTRQVMEPSH